MDAEVKPGGQQQLLEQFKKRRQKHKAHRAQLQQAEAYNNAVARASGQRAGEQAVTRYRVGLILAESRIHSLISGKQEHLIKITSLLDSIKDKDREREALLRENSELRSKVDDFMALQHESDNNKLSKLAMELEK